MKQTDIYLINKKTDTDTVEDELAETLSMVESSLLLIADQLMESIDCPHQSGFLALLLKHMKTTSHLYYLLYEPTALLNNKDGLFFINPSLGKGVLQNELVASIHQLQSLCYFAAYQCLVDLDSHTVNHLTVINKYMIRAVSLIDLLSLHVFMPMPHEEAKLSGFSS